MLIEKVTPVDPRPAPHATGVVQLTVVVGRDGAVADVRPLTGPELLLDPAAAAVRQWKYRPTLLNGFPVEVQFTLEVTFTPAR